MYPIFYKSKYRAYESYLFHNAEGIHAVIDQSEFVIVDAFVNDTMDKKTLEYIRSKMLLYKSFMSKYYGSEGKHENNMIEIYRKK